MAIASLTFEPSIHRPRRYAPLDYEKLEAAVEHYDNGRALESIHGALEHLFPGHFSDTSPANLENGPFVFTQGSARVTVRFDGDALLISAPLVRLPAGGNTIAAMRYILTKISGSGQLHQPELRGDEVYITFQDKLTRIHPIKLIEVLQRIPIEADQSDDWLIGQFSAEPLERGEILELTEDEATRAELFWQRHWGDVEELLTECQRKRSLFFLNELTAYALWRVRHTLPLTGYVGLLLAEAASTFGDANVEPSKREATLVKCIRTMKAVTRAELEQSMGHATYALNPRAEGTPAILIGNLGADRDYMQTIERLRTAGNTMDAAFALIGTYSFLLGRFSWPEPVEAGLIDGLTQTSGKPWREVASLLLEHAKGLTLAYTNTGEDDTPEGGGANDAQAPTGAAGEYA